MDIQKIKTNVERQIENPDWDKIKALAEQKKKLLNNIISDEGALHLAVQELYPDYKASQMRKSGIELKGRLINKTKPRVVETKKSGQKPIRDVFIATEDAGVMQATLWGKARVELFKNIEHGDAIKLSDVKIGNKDGETVLNFFDNSTVEKIEDKSVKQLTEMLEPINLSLVKVSKIGSMKGVIIQTTDIEFKTCPICNSKLSEVEDTHICPTHQEVPPVIKKAEEITIDTGNGIIGTILWPELLKEGDKPKQMEIITSVCRVYDSNYFAREKARAGSEISEEILNKQFPVELKLSIYSYDLESTSVKKTQGKTDTKNAEPVPVEQIENV